MKIMLFFLLSACVLCVSCESQKKSDEIRGEKSGAGNTVDEITRIKNTVLLYDALLADGYRNQNMTGLLEVATEERAQKSYYHMAALGEGYVKMDSILNEIIFTDVKMPSPDRAEAKTEEKWDYKYIDIRSGKEVYDNSVTYVLGYDLVKKSGKWLVNDITIVSSKEKKSERYGPVENSGGM